MRPSWLPRVFAALFGIFFIPVSVAIVSGPEVDGYWPAVFVAGMWTASGILFNTAKNQGAYIRGDSLVMETVLGRARIPLSDIDAIHFDRGMSHLVASTGGRHVYQSIAAPVMFGDPEEAAREAERQLGLAGIAVHWLDTFADWEALRPRRMASFEGAAMLSTFARPWVAGMAITGTLVSVLMFS